jgi:diguanylate cyclase (GGDEF)-like protein
MASALVRRVRTLRGDEGVADLLSQAGVPYTAPYLEDIGNWIWYDEATALFEAAIELTGDPGIARRVGEEMVQQHAGTPVATLLRSLGSPEAIFQQLSVAVTKFSTVTEMSPLEVSPGRAVLEAKARPGFRRHRALCEWSQGLLSQATPLFGLPPARVDESACELRGDDHCLYTVTWDAEAADEMADPQALISALEAQVAAMKDRLESMFATARDLIAFDDVDAALARVTERAATAVRAPKYLLAVRLDHTDQVYVHHRGFVDEDPHTVAEALLAGRLDPSDDSCLIAEVASARRRYGWLIAASPTQSFFAQERDLLDVYARYAAAVLDAATALDTASWRADHDALTELFNRRRLTAELERELLHAARYEHSGALLMLDLDNFKFVNDSYGHAAGDRLLRSIGQVLADRVRGSDVVARLGGDEFAVILPEADGDQARTVAEALRREIRATPSDLPLPPEVSVGIALFGSVEQATVDGVLAAADVALYRAKERGGARVELYCPDASGRLTWVARIQDALRDERFLLYAQPLVDLRSGDVVREELLLRLASPDGEIIDPGQFLPTAEHVGLVTSIDRWVVRQAVALALEGRRVAINLSGRSIGDDEVLAIVRAAVEAGLDPSSLAFEITETGAVGDLAAAGAFTRELSDLGCDVALDDFGTGFGSFTYLKHLSTAYLKIDIEFVRNVVHSEVDRRVVAAIVETAHALGKLTVAEGVEDEATLEALRALGVDWAQGFHLGAPGPL